MDRDFSTQVQKYELELDKLVGKFRIQKEGIEAKVLKLKIKLGRPTKQMPSVELNNNNPNNMKIPMNPMTGGIGGMGGMGGMGVGGMGGIPSPFQMNTTNFVGFSQTSKPEENKSKLSTTSPSISNSRKKEQIEEESDEEEEEKPKKKRRNQP